MNPLDEVKAMVAQMQKDLSDYITSHEACHQTPSQPQTVNTVPASSPPKVITVAPFPPMIVKWANAIKQLEGAPDETNPGNLKYAPLTASWGATPGRAGSDGGHLAHFKDYSHGFNALCNFLLLGCHDELASYHNARTLGEFTFIYTGKPKPNLDYRPTLSKILGVSLDTDISTFLASSVQSNGAE